MQFNIFDTGSYCADLECQRTHYVVQTILEFKIFSFQPPSWDYRHEPLWAQCISKKFQTFLNRDHKEEFAAPEYFHVEESAEAKEEIFLQSPHLREWHLHPLKSCYLSLIPPFLISHHPLTIRHQALLGGLNEDELIMPENQHSVDAQYILNAQQVVAAIIFMKHTSPGIDAKLSPQLP